jgi:hypothetical protein
MVHEGHVRPLGYVLKELSLQDRNRYRILAAYSRALHFTDAKAGIVRRRRTEHEQSIAESCKSQKGQNNPQLGLGIAGTWLPP